MRSEAKRGRFFHLLMKHTQVQERWKPDMQKEITGSRRVQCCHSEGGFTQMSTAPVKLTLCSNNYFLLHKHVNCCMQCDEINSNPSAGMSCASLGFEIKSLLWQSERGILCQNHDDLRSRFLFAKSSETSWAARHMTSVKNLWRRRSERRVGEWTVT